MVHQALTNQNSGAAQTEPKNKHLFIDLMGYQDLQLLKARKG
jgi:hypothetical protein